VYEKWALAINSKMPSDPVAFTYTGTSSENGMRCLMNGTCDFAGLGSLPNAELQAHAPDLWVVPVLAGAVAIMFNLREVADLELRITREQLAQVFLGRIRKWSELAHRNPKLEGVNESIALVVRSDVSETSEVLTSALSSFSFEWQGKVGTSKMPIWPGFTTRSQGTKDMAVQILRQPYSLGYIWQANVETFLLARALIENDAGEFVAPSASSVNAAMDAAVEAFQTMGQSTRMLAQTIVDPKNLTETGARDAYPISALAYLSFDASRLGCRLMHDVLYLIYWAWTEASKSQAATRPGLFPLSSRLVKALLQLCKTSPDLSCDGGLHPLVEQLTLEFNEKCPPGMHNVVCKVSSPSSASRSLQVTESTLRILST
jgi:phosphate transport system substrate-binding protein